MLVIRKCSITPNTEISDRESQTGKQKIRINESLRRNVTLHDFKRHKVDDTNANKYVNGLDCLVGFVKFE